MCSQQQCLWWRQQLRRWPASERCTSATMTAVRRQWSCLLRRSAAAAAATNVVCRAKQVWWQQQDTGRRQPARSVAVAPQQLPFSMTTDRQQLAVWLVHMLAAAVLVCRCVPPALGLLCEHPPVCLYPSSPCLYGFGLCWLVAGPHTYGLCGFYGCVYAGRVLPSAVCLPGRPARCVLGVALTRVCCVFRHCSDLLGCVGCVVSTCRQGFWVLGFPLIPFG